MSSPEKRPSLFSHFAFYQTTEWRKLLQSITITIAPCILSPFILQSGKINDSHSLWRKTGRESFKDEIGVRNQTGGSSKHVALKNKGLVGLSEMSNILVQILTLTPVFQLTRWPNPIQLSSTDAATMKPMVREQTPPFLRRHLWLLPHAMLPFALQHQCWKTG